MILERTVAPHNGVRGKVGQVYGVLHKIVTYSAIGTGGTHRA